MADLKGKKILLGVTGSIAAYKAATLVRLLIKAGAEVQVITTKAANEFIAPITLSTLSKKPVLYDVFNADQWNNHVQLGRWADIMVVAPLSCNTLAKMANGLCDNLLLAVYLSATCPVMVAPAMDEDMWIHPSTKRNIEALTQYGNQVLNVNHGELASGLIGPGRMAEPEAILKAIESALNPKLPLKGKRVLITAGPTHEALDPVRFIGNHSTGKMGVALANAASKQGAQVTLVLGPTETPHIIAPKVDIVHVTSANDMLNAALKNFEQADIAILSAAVADFAPKQTSTQKIKKGLENSITIELVKTPDILHTLGHTKTSSQIVVGFALETNNELENAKKKLLAKKADMIVLNSMQVKGAGFGHDTNQTTIITSDGRIEEFPLKPKTEVAQDILATIIAYSQKT
jgi:phosphopantothenoylcysteine decarboxylase / phosphopantothenate---cysteine ligase